MNRVRPSFRHSLALFLATAALAAGTAGAEPLPVTHLPVVEVRASLPAAAADHALLARAPVRLPTVTVVAQAPPPAPAPRPLAAARPWLPVWALFDTRYVYLAEWPGPADAGTALLALGLACSR